MRTLIRSLGIICILLAIVFFIHGSIKSVDAQKEESVTHTLDEGIIMVEKKQADKFANVSFSIAGVASIAGVLLLLLSRKNRGL